MRRRKTRGVRETWFYWSIFKWLQN